MVLAMILGPIAAESFFQAWMIGNRSLTIFFIRPLSIGLILFLCLIMVGPHLSKVVRRVIKS